MSMNLGQLLNACVGNDLLQRVAELCAEPNECDFGLAELLLERHPCVVREFVGRWRRGWRRIPSAHIVLRVDVRIKLINLVQVYKKAW